LFVVFLKIKVDVSMHDIVVLWCPLRFLHKNDFQLVFTSSCL